MSFALDSDILIYASDTSSPYFERCRKVIESAITQREIFYLAWSSIHSYLRIATHPVVFENPLSPDEAMANIEILINLPHARILSEEEGFWDVYRKGAAEIPSRGNEVAQAYLAALLRYHGVKTLYTSDAEFRKFSFLKVRDPLRE